MKVSRQVFGQLAECILEGGAYKATKYYGDKLVVKATRRRYKGMEPAGCGSEILFTIGPPNYEERAFIEKCFAAEAPLPVKKIQLKYPPKAKK
jgi:hypothetical protein